MGKNAFRYGCLFIIIFILIACSLTAQNLKGSIAGIVIDEVTQQPLPGVNIFIQGTKIGTASDNAGRFLLSDLPPGTYHVQFQMIGYQPLTKLNLPVSPGRTLELSIGLTRTIINLESVVVTPDLYKKAKDALVSDRVVDFTEIINDPGSSMDVQRMMQALPSVVSSTDQYNEIIVRGGAPGENLFLLDNIEISNPNHFGEYGSGGGPICMINPLFISEVNFYAGTFPARFGDKMSSVMDITLREGNRQHHETLLDMGMAGIGFLTEGPFANRRGSYMFSYHKSFLDMIIANTGLTAVPQYYNAQGKIVFDLNSRHQLIWNAVFGNDRIDIINEDPKASRGAENVHVKGQEWATGLSWKALWNRQTYSLTTASAVGNYWWYKAFHDDGRVYSYTDVTETDYTLKSDLVYRPSEISEWSAGFALKNCRGDYLNWNLTDTLFGYGYYIDGAQTYIIPTSWPLTGRIDSIIVIDTLEYPQKNILDDRLNTWKTAAYLQFKWNPLKSLTLVTGVRFDRFAYSGNSSIAPRLGISYRLSPNTTFNCGFGRHYQTPFNAFFLFNSANRKLRNKYSDQVVCGIDHLINREIRTTIEIYSRRLHDLPVFASATTPDSMDDDNGHILNAGKGHVEGIEFFIQKKLTTRFHWIASYSYYVAKLTDPRYGDREYNASYDFRHTLTAICGYREKLIDNQWYQNIKQQGWYPFLAWILPLADELELSLRWRSLGGKPYTPVTYDPYTRRWYTPAQQALNTRRLPAYHRLDFKFNRRFIFKKMNLVTYIEVQNLFNRDNIWDYTYDRDGSRNTVYQYKLFPSGGFILEL